MTYTVPFVDPKTHYQKLKMEIDAAITGCLSRGDLVNRRQLRDFEVHLADFVGVRYAVGLNSCYHALYFSLLAQGIGRGDEVITAGHTFVATVSAIVNCGAEPVLIEVGEDYNMDASLLEAAITPRTRAVLPVHLNGRMCDMERIMAIAQKYGLVVIEDAAQALGARFKGRNAGGIGLTGCWSFYPFKALGGFGDGGAITTNNPEIARTVTLLRYNGEDRQTGEYYHHGQTALLDNVQAAVLDMKLRHLPNWIEHRRHIADLYRTKLQHIQGLSLPHFGDKDHFDIYQNYVIRSKERDALREYLTSCGVETLVSWPKPMWQHKGLGLQDPHLPETESICREVLSLPITAETTPEQVDTVVQHIHQFFSRNQAAQEKQGNVSTCDRVACAQ
jgi:dTDP-4-amino-4,6-dideoxygalactose transaminase